MMKQPKLSTREARKQLGEQWKAMDADAKQPYHDLAVPDLPPLLRASPPALALPPSLASLALEDAHRVTVPAQDVVGSSLDALHDGGPARRVTEWESREGRAAASPVAVCLELFRPPRLREGRGGATGWDEPSRAASLAACRAACRAPELTLVCGAATGAVLLRELQRRAWL